MKHPFPVPAVRAIVTNPAGCVLLLRRAENSAGGGRWCLPGGKVDYGDTVEQALEKELLQETGLRCLSRRFLFYQDSPPLEPEGMHCLNLYFSCETEGDVVINGESSGFAWVPMDGLARYDIVFGHDAGLERYALLSPAEGSPR